MPDQNISRTLLWAKDLLNNVQEEHEFLVSQSIVHQDSKPPIANFNDLSKGKQKLIKGLWDNLVQGSSNIQITETETRTDPNTGTHTRNHAGFRNKALAQFARLLETSTGLEIINHLSKDTNGNKLITIKPTLSKATDGFSKSEPAASPEAMNGSDKLIEFDMKKMFKNQKNATKKREKYSRNFVSLNLKSMANVKERTAAIYNVRKEYSWAKGIKVGAKYYKFGSGTAVNITLTPDIPDSADHETSRFVDATKNEIPTPNYITLGHELGHAVHMQTGASLGENSTTMSLFDHVAPGLTGKQKGEWSDVEEYSNIHHVENSIRREYGMKNRYGHINQKSVQVELLDKIENKLYRIGTLFVNNNNIGTYRAQLGQLNRDSGAKNVSDFRTHAVALIDYLSQHLNTMFPNYTPLELRNIRAKLLLASNGTSSTKENEINTAEAELQLVYTQIQGANVRVAALPPPIAPQAPSITSKVLKWIGF